MASTQHSAIPPEAFRVANVQTQQGTSPLPRGANGRVLPPRASCSLDPRGGAQLRLRSVAKPPRAATPCSLAVETSRSCCAAQGTVGNEAHRGHFTPWEFLSRQQG